jgi:alkylated DNA repair dioxygenase AlkB
MTETYTLTFGNRAENHTGMQIIGNKYERGLSLQDLLDIKAKMETLGKQCQLVDLTELLPDRDTSNIHDAYLLVVKDGVSSFVNSFGLYEEQRILPKDTKAYMYGRVVNKKARYNLCFSDFSQQPDYANKKGTVINFRSLPQLQQLRNELGNLHALFKDLQCEGNYYYDISKTYIGYHGDTEREIVVGVRLGATFPLYYQWYENTNPVGNKFKIDLDHGDIYIMGDKAVGRDWKTRNLLTLRHAAGINM